MSTHAAHTPELQPRRPIELPAWMGRPGIYVLSLLAALVGLLLLALGLFIEPQRAWFSYLDAWTFGATVCIGALCLLMVGHAAKASWMLVTRRLTEAVVDALPLYLLLSVPLAFGLTHIYPWAQNADLLDPALRHAIEHKRGYLSRPLFEGRTVLYLAEFIVIGALLRRWSTQNDRHPRIELVHRMRRLSAGALPLVGLTLTWASFDWTMSLEPDWYSTMYGLYYFAAAFVGAISLTGCMLHLSHARLAARSPVTGDHAQALGRLLFAMIIFWAYIAFGQLLIYWIGDVPQEVTFYARRTSGSWTAVTYLLVFGHFVVPFFLLLNRHWKRRTNYLATISAWMFFMHFVDVYWLIMPVLDGAGVRPHWLDLAAALFVGGVSCAWVVRRYLRALPLPRHEPDLAEGLLYEAAL